MCSNNAFCIYKVESLAFLNANAISKSVYVLTRPSQGNVHCLMHNDRTSCK
jgi:hypothetical protein